MKRPATATPVVIRRTVGALARLGIVNNSASSGTIVATLWGLQRLYYRPLLDFEIILY